MDTDGRWISLVTPEDLNRSKLEWAKESRSHMQLAGNDNCEDLERWKVYGSRMKKGRKTDIC